ncbi:hypothetical protein CDL15_Pgr026487 [Punica granatum]|uniref:Uncharacterized protein n=1 Tax=Punica granatum TaxID=22663 RepID=A0A218WLL2_PUNGR|nr:hypothetical protein CDL15_Pgr026487 [Punica granatum]
MSSSHAPFGDIIEGGAVDKETKQVVEEVAVGVTRLYYQTKCIDSCGGGLHSLDSHEEYNLAVLGPFWGHLLFTIRCHVPIEVHYHQQRERVHEQFSEAISNIPISSSYSNRAVTRLEVFFDEDEV